ncbi:MAG: hypothetical protein WBC93_05535 [Sulfitobacter sp.]
MPATLVGYDFPSKQPHGKQANDASVWPSQPAAVYRDADGNHFVGLPHDEGVAAVPYIPGSQADGSDGPVSDEGGFVPIEKMPDMPKKNEGRPAPGSDNQAAVDEARGRSPAPPVDKTTGQKGRPDGRPSPWRNGGEAATPLSTNLPGSAEPPEPEFEDLMAGMLSQMAPGLAADWLGQAVGQAMVAGGSEGVMGAAMNAMGLANPLASGPVAAVFGAALDSAGVGGLKPLLPSLGSALQGESTAALADAMGRQGLKSLLAAAGLSGIPGANKITNFLGDEVGEQLQGMFTGGLDSLSSDLSSSLDGLSVDGLTADLENAIKNIDVNAIASQGLDAAATELMSQWKVDDESSAAETIAHKAVSENMGELTGLAKDELLKGKGGGLAGLRASIAKFFAGEAPGACLPVIRMGDLDDGGDVSLTGVANILVEGQPVSRMKDMVAGPKAPPPGKQILEGAATVLSAGIPTAFVSSAVEVPSIMIKGAATVFLGGAVASVAPPKKKLPSLPNANAGPAAPKGPKSTKSGSGSTSENDANGENPESDALASAAPSFDASPVRSEDASSQPSDPAREDYCKKQVGYGLPSEVTPTLLGRDGLTNRDGTPLLDEHGRQVTVPVYEAATKNSGTYYPVCPKDPTTGCVVLGERPWYEPGGTELQNGTRAHEVEHASQDVRADGQFGGKTSGTILEREIEARERQIAYLQRAAANSFPMLGNGPVYEREIAKKQKEISELTTAQSLVSHEKIHDALKQSNFYVSQSICTGEISTPKTETDK